MTGAKCSFGQNSKLCMTATSHRFLSDSLKLYILVQMYAIMNTNLSSILNCLTYIDPLMRRSHQTNLLDGPYITPRKLYFSENDHDDNYFSNQKHKLVWSEYPMGYI